MYDFVFFLAYSRQKQKHNSDAFARLNGSLIATLAIFIHLVLIFVIYKKLFLAGNERYRWGNNILDYVIGIFFCVIGYLYYNEKRTKIILDKYNGALLPVNSINISKMLAIIFIPFIIAALLSTKPR